MVDGCRGGAHFLFIDRSDRATSEKVERLITDLKLEVRVRDETKDNIDTDEEKTELQEIADFLLVARFNQFERI